MIDCIVVTFESDRYMPVLLSTLAAAHGTTPLRLILVDNCSRISPTTTKVVQGLPFEVVEYVMDRNRGFAAGVNRGISMSNADRPILLLNPDVTFEPGALKEMISTLQSPRVVAVGARLRNPDGRPVSTARAFPTLRQIAFRTSVDMSGTGVATEVDWLCGAFILWRAGWLRNHGGLDESYFMYYEDVEIFHRVRAHDGLAILRDDLVVIHDAGHGKPTSAKLRSVNRQSRRRYAMRRFGWKGLVASTSADILGSLSSLRRKLRL